ncbi:Glycosyltransferase involved in cell wall bisynthesis [Tranquillimonas rosea]|uniref:Glycosyltransferase involved in cell wall bisynthesis n=1 Tax=Tranquillimonas rosea TaxID=641238 RepID=A0A1H9W3B4_9RHOB|nr:glycosyltransferase family 2 protein [Tranquillimonas rosea]SES27993.1 Glycosyltransferase involved in cell wall bisynthesis [Tranquillimonas rosea]
MRLSIVIPARNEAENIGALVEGIAQACAAAVPFEIIVVDDASTDRTGAVLDGMRERYPMLRMLRHETAGGQSAAIHAGVSAARAPVVCTLDGDGQNPPEELPGLFGPLLSADAPPELALVAGQRVGRQDSRSKRWASTFANNLRQSLLGDGTRDTGCGLKAFRREAFLALPRFNHMHRFLPALFLRDGWTISHVDVSHRPRRAGRSNYNNLRRGLVGVVDLVGVMWLVRRRITARAAERPAGDAAADAPLKRQA